MIRETERKSCQILTLREIEVLKQVRNGYSNKQIAGELNITEKTVETHKFNMVKKLNLKGTRDLLIYSAIYFFNISILILANLLEEIS